MSGDPTCQPRGPSVSPLKQNLSSRFSDSTAATTQSHLRIHTLEHLTAHRIASHCSRHTFVVVTVQCRALTLSGSCRPRSIVGHCRSARLRIGDHQLALRLAQVQRFSVQRTSVTAKDGTSTGQLPTTEAYCCPAIAKLPPLHTTATATPAAAHHPRSHCFRCFAFEKHCERALILTDSI